MNDFRFVVVIFLFAILLFVTSIKQDTFDMMHGAVSVIRVGGDACYSQDQ